VHSRRRRLLLRRHHRLVHHPQEEEEGGTGNRNRKPFLVTFLGESWDLLAAFLGRVEVSLSLSPSLSLRLRMTETGGAVAVVGTGALAGVMKWRANSPLRDPSSIFIRASDFPNIESLGAGTATASVAGRGHSVRSEVDATCKEKSE
jgi:hypothetical protein